MGGISAQVLLLIPVPAATGGSEHGGNREHQRQFRFFSRAADDQRWRRAAAGAFARTAGAIIGTGGERAFTGGRPAPRDPRAIQIEIAELVENGNTVPVSVRVASPMTADAFVRRIALFTERNPQPEVAVFQLSPAIGRAEVATRMRLATSQQVLAVAEFGDGRFVQAAVDVIVTLAACIES